MTNLEMATLTRTEESNGLALRTASPVLACIPTQAQGLLSRMFADPNLLEKSQRADLAEQMRACVRANPRVSELRVLLGMALCVNFEVPDAIEELREAVLLAPDSYIARLKMGELWMRLRVIDKAEEHTHQAALLAQNLAQSELARRQAATIRKMKLEGVERGGLYKGPLSVAARFRRLFTRDRSEESLATMDAL